MTRVLRSLATGGAVTLVSLVIIKSMAFLNSIIAARLLGPNDYGAYSIIFNLQSFASIIACCGIPISLAKHVAQFRGIDQRTAERTGSYLMTILLISSIATSSIYFALADVLAVSLYGDSHLSLPIRLSSFYVLVSCVNMAFASTVQGCREISKLARVNSIVAVSALPIMYSMISIWGLEGAILSLLVSALVSVVLLWNILTRVLSLSLTLRKPYTEPNERSIIVSFAVPSFFSSLLLVPAFWFGRTVLAVSWGLDSVGEFQVGESLSQLMLIIPAAVSVPLLPLISEIHASDSTRVSQMTGNLLRVMVFLIVPIGIIAFPFLESAIQTMYGGEYTSASTTTTLMFCCSSVVAISTVMSTVIIGTGRMWLGLGMNIIWATCFFAFVIILVPSTSSEGLATTYVLSHTVYLTALFIYFNRVFEVRVLSLVGPILVFLSFTACHILVLSSYDLIVEIGLAFAVASITAMMTHRWILQPEERSLIKSIVTRVIRIMRG